jgi:hypothetical protein
VGNPLLVKLSLFSHRQSTLHCVCLIQWEIVEGYSIEKICNLVSGKKDRHEKKFSPCSRYANNSPWDSYSERIPPNRICYSCSCKFLDINSWKGNSKTGRWRSVRNPCKLPHTNSRKYKYNHFQSSLWKLSDDSKYLHV